MIAQHYFVESKVEFFTIWSADQHFPNTLPMLMRKWILECEDI